MSCSTGIVKYLVFFFNLIFALGGLALLALGIYVKIQSNTILHVTDYLSSDIHTTLLIIVGSIIFITAFFGCCGAIKENTCMLTTFAIILLTLLIIQVAIGVYAFVQGNEDPDSAKDLIKQGVQDLFNNYNITDKDNNALDVVQDVVHCCGVDGPSDWNWPDGALPRSCCGMTTVSCSTSSSNLFHAGCSEKVYDAIVSALYCLGAVTLVVAFIELLGGIFALCLASSLRNQRRRLAYA